MWVNLFLPTCSLFFGISYMFIYTFDDLARECNTDWLSIQGIMETIGIMEYNNSIGEYDCTVKSRGLYAVRNFKIYWHENVLEMLKLKIL